MEKMTFGDLPIGVRFCFVANLDEWVKTEDDACEHSSKGILHRVHKDFTVYVEPFILALHELNG